MDKNAQLLAKAIGIKESGGDYNAKGKSGEFGAYQFMPTTYKAYAKKYIGDENAEPNIENQNKIVYSFVKEKKDKGYTPAQIASMWNAGEDSPNAYLGNAGVNSKGVRYDTGAYTRDVLGHFKRLGSQFPEIKTPQEQKQELHEQGKPVSVQENRVEPTLAGSLIRGITKPIITAGVSIARGIGGTFDKNIREQGITLPTKYWGDVKDIATEAKESAENLADKYKAGEVSGAGVVPRLLAIGAKPAVDLATTFTPAGALEGVGGKIISKAIPEALPGITKQAIETSKTGFGKSGLIGKTLKSTGRGFALGSGLNTVEQLSKGGEYDPYQAFTSGLLGSGLDVAGSVALPGAINLGVKGGKGIMGKFAPAEEKLQNSKNQILKDYDSLIAEGGAKYNKYFKNENTAKELQEAKEVATKYGVVPRVDETGNKWKTIDEVGQTEIQPRLDEIDDKLTKYIEANDKQVDLNKWEAKALAEAESAYKGNSQKAGIIEDIKSIFEQYKQEAGSDYGLLSDVQRAKQQAYKNTYIANKPGAEVYRGIKPKANEIIGKTGKDFIADEIGGEQIIHDLNSEYGKLIKTDKFLRTMDGQTVKGGKIGKYFAGVTGGIAGSHFGVFGTLLGEQVAEWVQQKLATNYFNTKVGQEVLRDLQKTEPQIYQKIEEAIKLKNAQKAQQKLLPSKASGGVIYGQPYKGISKKPIVTSGIIPPKNYEEAVKMKQNEGIIKLYRGEGNNYTGELSDSSHFTTSKKRAENYGVVKEYTLPKNSKIAGSDIMKNFLKNNKKDVKKYQDFLKKEGYDGYRNLVGDYILFKK